jgi:hypothetical protein
MKKMTLLFALLMTTPTSANQMVVTGPSDLICDVGPVSKTYGDTTWLVYACNDGRSLNIVSGPRSKALPFVFLFHWERGAYQLAGVGTGNKAFTDAAFSELRTFKTADIERLLAEAQASARHK